MDIRGPSPLEWEQDKSNATQGGLFIFSDQRNDQACDACIDKSGTVGTDKGNNPYFPVIFLQAYG